MNSLSLARIALLSATAAFAACGGEAGSSEPQVAPPPAAQSPKPLMEIHTVADFLAARPGDPTGAKTSSVDALIRDVKDAAESGAWPGREDAVVKAQGDALIIRASKPYQDAAASYLTARRTALQR